MGSFPSQKVSSTFDPKLLQVDLVSEISVIKNDGRKKKYSNSSLNTNNNQNNKNEYIPKNDPKCMMCFLYEKFDALKELSLDDDLDDGNPIEIKKIDINKNVFPKKSNHVKFPKNKNSNSNKHLIAEKIRKPINPKRKEFSCGNVVKRKFCQIDDLKEKSNLDKNTEFTFHEGNYGNKNNLHSHHHHKKHAKSKKNKDHLLNPSLSTIKSKKSDCDEEEQKNTKDSLDPIRAILKEMGK